MTRRVRQQDGGTAPHSRGLSEWARLVLEIEESLAREEILGADDLVAHLRDPNVDPMRGTIAALNQARIFAYAGFGRGRA